LQNYTDYVSTFGVDIDPFVTKRGQAALKEAAVTFATGRAVHVLQVETERVAKRRKLNETMVVLEASGGNEADLHRVLADQIAKGIKV
jgi:hypothetical protein